MTLFLVLVKGIALGIFAIISMRALDKGEWIVFCTSYAAMGLGLIWWQ